MPPPAKKPCAPANGNNMNPSMTSSQPANVERSREIPQTGRLTSANEASQQQNVPPHPNGYRQGANSYIEFLDQVYEIANVLATVFPPRTDQQNGQALPQTEAPADPVGGGYAPEHLPPHQGVPGWFVPMQGWTAPIRPPFLQFCPAPGFAPTPWFPAPYGGPHPGWFAPQYGWYGPPRGFPYPPPPPPMYHHPMFMANYNPPQHGAVNPTPSNGEAQNTDH
ncbi:U1 small nuclear ribonucleoprotein C [Caenorhabditis elegans]|uniref:U1 small nuclear ribonucleoprotein C n=1 Tax=Caenorhabditis elegans TaxID=6239 RepID=Q966F2_CAEEL|nr:U1 small nuclear ribonucleoprotein C [Caenorhabditis elegans]CCD67538.3 U1 small nuclear ribonucleoprotein C [Caenorhabditis elegans]|eukprot:NP_508227.3 Uncharacterized protein CELE_T13G4.7 [Caenorhabditis elegans]